MIRFVAALLLGLFFANPLVAKEWIIDYASSSLTFTGTQGGQPFTGKFGIFLVATDFNPDKPDKSSLKVTIDMGSASTGDKQKDEALPQKEWFDSKLQDKAELFGVNIKKMSETKFIAFGKLDIKGKIKDIELPFEMETVNDGKRFKGSLDINRTDFDVGTGEWLSDKFIGHTVRIDVSIMAYEKK